MARTRQDTPEHNAILGVELLCSQASTGPQWLQIGGACDSCRRVRADLMPESLSRRPLISDGSVVLLTQEVSALSSITVSFQGRRSVLLLAVIDSNEQ